MLICLIEERRYDVNKNIGILMLFDCVRVQNTGLGIH
jgi:hypothetical protein